MENKIEYTKESFELLIKSPEAYLVEADASEKYQRVIAFHQTLRNYEVTPLRALNDLARSLQIKGLYVKDESSRFGLNAFKGLGASYAMHEILKTLPSGSYTFVSCTDGNHGKALAWRAKMLGHKAVIFMPIGSEMRRIKAIEAFDAKVVVTEMNYDDTVRFAAEYAAENGCYLVQDTALPGYERVPQDIVLGYTTMVQEALNQIPVKPTHVFVQAGVGSMAGGVIGYLNYLFHGEMPLIGVMEASSVACIYESVKQNTMVCIGGEPYTAMAGLNCGEANPLVFPMIKALSTCFFKCEDVLTFKGMDRAKHPMGEDPAFSSGESGAVGLGLVETLLSHPDYLEIKTALKLDENSVVLLFSTEGEI